MKEENLIHEELQRDGFHLITTKHFILIVSFFMIILLYFSNHHTILRNDTFQVPVAIQNVLQDSLETQWNSIEKKIDPSSSPQQHYLLESFHVLATKEGEILTMDFSFSKMQSSGKKAWYFMHMEKGETQTTVTMSETKPPAVPEQGQIEMNDFVHLLNPLAMQAICPNDGDAISLTFNSHFAHVTENEIKRIQQSYYSLLNNQVRGPIHEGNGYLVTVFSMRKENDNSYSSIHGKTYLVGGHE